MIDPTYLQAMMELSDLVSKRKIKKGYINQVLARLYLFNIEFTADYYITYKEKINRRVIDILVTRLKFFMQDVLEKSYKEIWDDFDRQLERCKDYMELILCIRDWSRILSDKLFFLMPPEQIKNIKAIEKEYGVEGRLPFLKAFFKGKTKEKIR